jgi:hypothetical protein
MAGGPVDGENGQHRTTIWPDGEGIGMGSPGPGSGDEALHAVFDYYAEFIE